jgi:hypothetical protein
VSELRSVVELSLEVFVSLITGFREFLRGEIEIFITDIFLRVLESSSRCVCICMRVYACVDLF